MKSLKENGTLIPILVTALAEYVAKFVPLKALASSSCVEVLLFDVSNRLSSPMLSSQTLAQFDIVHRVHKIHGIYSVHNNSRDIT